MYRKFCALALLLVLFLTGCTEAATLDPREVRTEEALAENEWGVTLSADNVTPTGLTIVCERDEGSEAEISTTPVFKVYMRSDDVWVPYERTDGEFGYKAWEQVFYELAADEPLLLEADWTWLHGELPAGKYLLMKRFFAQESQDNRKAPEIFFVFAEFEIEE